MAIAYNSDMTDGTRAQRKLLITVAEWGGTGSDDGTKEILGVRTEDSSIEFNADIQTSTDILGTTYTDVNKTEPQQSFDPFYVIGGSQLALYLSEAALKNDINKYNNVFNVYIITAYMTNGSSSASDGKYFCVKHEGCSIIPTSLGGDSYVSMPIEVHYSNKITTGTVDKLTDAFKFTADANVVGG